MVANFPLTSLQKLLLEGLDLIPQDWALTPLRGNKAPYRTAWQHEPPLTRNQIIAEIESGAEGYGIRTGTISGGIVAIDIDGASAVQKALKLSGGEPLPDTVTFTSNRSGREQRLYLIPQEYWGAVKTIKIKTDVVDDDGKPEQLELRWDGCQSVLPPSIHPTTSRYRWRKSPEEVVIAPAPMWVIEAMLVEPDPPQQPEQHTAYTRKARTGEEWSNEEWALSYLSALNPSRADDYENWLAVGMALHSVGDSLLSNWDNWSRQSCKYNPGCCEKKWKSFKRQGVAIGTLAHMAKQDGWRSPFDKSSGRGYSGGIGGGSSGGGGDDGDGGFLGGKVIKHPSFNPISPEELEARLDALIQEGLSSAKLTNRLNHLASETGRHVVELRKQYSERLDEVEREEGREDTQSQIDALIDASRASVDLREVLPSALAEPLLKLAGWLNLKPECYLTTLLTTASILHKAGTKVVLNKEWDFEVTPNLYSAIIAASSQKKSPIIKAICTKPLKVLQQEALSKYKQQLQIYSEELKEWEATKPDDRGEPPVKPERKIYFFTKTTGEGLTYQAARCPEQGMLYLTDELAGMLNAQNQYRGGKGSDKQDLLSYYDGSGDVVLRAEGVKSEVDFILLGLLGGIQPKIMQKLLDDCSDSDGGWARFMFVNQPNAASRMSSDGGKYDLSELLSDLYRKIDALPPTEYRLSPKAFRLFCKAYNRLEELRENDRLEGMQSVWGKSEGRIGKLAVNLHVIHALMKGEIPSEEIPVGIVRIAINLTKFYAQQVQSLYTQFSDPDALAPQLVKVIELSRKKGWLKASDVYLSITKKSRPSGETVREWYGELVVMGKGEVRGQGRSLQFRAFLPNESPPTPPKNKLDKLDKKLDDLSNAEHKVNQEVQEKLDKLDNLDDFPQATSICPKVGIQDKEAQELDDRIDEVAQEGKETVLSNLSNLSKKTQAQYTMGDTALDNASNTVSNLSKFSKTAEEEDIQEIAQSEPAVDAICASQQRFAIASTPLEQIDSTSADESEEAICEAQQRFAIAPIPDVESVSADEETLEDLVIEMLGFCESREHLQDICQAPEFTPALIDQASKRLSKEKQAQIETWLEQLMLKVGDRVTWENCPAHCERFSPFEIMLIDGNYAKLDLFEKPVLLAELRRQL